MLLKQQPVAGKSDLSPLHAPQPHKGSQLHKPNVIYANTFPGKSSDVSVLLLVIKHM